MANPFQKGDVVEVVTQEPFLGASATFSVIGARHIVQSTPNDDNVFLHDEDSGLAWNVGCFKLVSRPRTEISDV